MDEDLVPFLRQYRRNNSDELVAAFDLDGVRDLVASLRAQEGSRAEMLTHSCASLQKENERLWRVVETLCKR